MTVVVTILPAIRRIKMAYGIDEYPDEDDDGKDYSEESRVEQEERKAAKDEAEWEARHDR